MADVTQPAYTAQAHGGASGFGRALRGLAQLLLLVLVVLAFPLVILLIGLPVALLIRGFVEVAQMF